MKSLAILCITMLFSSMIFGAMAEDDGALHIDEFGVMKGVSIDTGFMFVNGKYLECPYSVSRRGLAIFVNSTIISPPLPWPVKPPPSGEIDPSLPATITTNTSFYDETVGNYLREKIAYIQKHFSPEEEQKNVEQVLRHLPCVKFARIDQEHPNILHVTTYKNENIPCALRTPRRRGIDFSKRENVLDHLESQRRYYEDNLKDGDCVFMTEESGRTSVGHNQEAFMIPLSNILSSNTSDKEKCSALANIRFFSRFTTNDLTKLVNMNTDSTQLVSRIRAVYGTTYKGLEKECLTRE